MVIRECWRRLDLLGGWLSCGRICLRETEKFGVKSDVAIRVRGLGNRYPPPRLPQPRQERGKVSQV